MDIQAEKLELIKLIAATNSEEALRKIKKIFVSEKSQSDTAGDAVSPVMGKRLKESKKHIAEGKGITVSLDDIWK